MPTGRSVRKLAVLVSLVLSAGALWMGWEAAGGPAVAQEGNEDCAVVTRISGRGAQETEPFQITGQTFRVLETFEGDSQDPEQSSVIYAVLDENGEVVPTNTAEDSVDIAPGSTETSYQDTATINSGPGAYKLGLVSEGGEYTYEIQDCGLSASGNGLMEAGGPESGPVPMMPDGACPEEYPVEKSGACHR